ncbi:MAG: rod shape-determining protein MreD [Ruminococcaceae bacterium]|nr:rod shape-determining protein MreD [Oscillospiraceae bacterium]
MKKSKLYLLLFILLIVQTSIINKLNLGGVFPNLILVVAFTFPFFLQQFDAVVFGFVCGLLLDLLTGRIIGVNAILITYIALFVSFISKKYIYNTTINVFIVTFVMTILYQFIYVFLYYLIWKKGTIIGAVPKMLLEALYNSMIASLGYYIIQKRRKKLKL